MEIKNVEELGDSWLDEQKDNKYEYQKDFLWVVNVAFIMLYNGVFTEQRHMLSLLMYTRWSLYFLEKRTLVQLCIHGIFEK